jgi:catabolite regulation protein CreA
MRPETIKLLDVVALLVDKPAEGLAVGHVGTVVEVFSPDVFEVEFLDPTGHTFALTELKRNEVLLLKHEPVAA